MIDEKRKGTVYIHVSTRHDGDLVPGEWVSTIEAIHRMQKAVVELRRSAQSKFDPSFGEQPPATLAPSEGELAIAVNHV